MPEITLHHDDSRAVLRRMIDAGIRVHSVACDPPYGLVSIAKRFGKGSAKAARLEGTDGSFSRLSNGFMGQQWDDTGIERDVEFWKLVFEVLLPGGYVAAFSSPRTGHRMATAIEDAGFVMHPFIAWAYSSGLPKPKRLRDEFEGFAYGAQARKPAMEPIYIAHKPFEARNGLENMRQFGVGAVNLDGCSIPPNLIDEWQARVPANLITDGTYPFSKFFETYPLIYTGKATAEDRAGSDHPSVKPINLMRAVVRHVTPPGGIVLDPFAGTGTTGVAAELEGMSAILIEREAKYAEVIARRFEMDTGARRLLRRLGR